MAHYRVTLWDTANIIKLAEVDKRQRPAAFNAAYALAYQSLMAFGKLDTIAAHKIKGEIDEANDLLPIGAQRIFGLSNTGRNVIVARVA